eukprot:GHVU01157473.1.p1 GENE.GHVU01157473.1~~GHVU01157473.1.p1  ORF type:complete len:105 (-),score=0.13 GHVU01157473.1:131-445(-)
MLLKIGGGLDPPPPSVAPVVAFSGLGINLLKSSAGSSGGQRGICPGPRGRGPVGGAPRLGGLRVLRAPLEASRKPSSQRGGETAAQRARPQSDTTTRLVASGNL